MSKTATTAQDGIDDIQLAIGECADFHEEAKYILDNLPAIKVAYLAKHKENGVDIASALPKPPSGSTADELLDYRTKLKEQEYGQSTRLNTIDRLQRQADIGVTPLHEQSLIIVFREMHDAICGVILP